MSSESTQFQRANIGAINGGVFNNYGPNETISDPLKDLLKECAMEATHTSATAEYAPKCKENTRVEVIGDIVQWIEARKSLALSSGASDQPILWFNGPAGGGKTCIMREVAKRCESSGDGTLVVSYFFSTRVPNLDNCKPFVFTIVQQLLEALPRLRPKVADVIRSTPSVFNKGLSTQVEMLILGPVKALMDEGNDQGHPLPSLRVLPVDGLDECRLVEERRKVLSAVQTLATNPIFPFHVIIGSRPEVDIRMALDTPPLVALTKIIRLENYDGTSDIRNYLCDEFQRIKQSHPLRHLLSEDWPKEDNVELLVEKSSSQFIFPSTAIRYVEGHRRDPRESLRRVLSLSTSTAAANDTFTANPFAELDCLYNFILHPPETDLALLRRLLHTLIFVQQRTITKMGYDERRGDPSAEFFDLLHELPHGSTDLAFCELHSLIRVPDPTRHSNGSTYSSRASRPTLQFHHKSIEDYLCTSTRSGDMYQSMDDTTIDLLPRSLRLLRELPHPELTHMQDAICNLGEAFITRPELYRSSTWHFLPAPLTLPVWEEKQKWFFQVMVDYDFDPACLRLHLQNNQPRIRPRFFYNWASVAHRHLCPFSRLALVKPGSRFCSTLCKRFESESRLPNF